MIKPPDKNLLEQFVFAYLGNGITHTYIAEYLGADEQKVLDALIDCNRQFDDIEVGEEGPTQEEQARIDTIIDGCVEYLIDL